MEIPSRHLFLTMKSSFLMATISSKKRSPSRSPKIFVISRQIFCWRMNLTLYLNLAYVFSYFSGMNSSDCYERTANSLEFLSFHKQKSWRTDFDVHDKISLNSRLKCLQVILERRKNKRKFPINDTWEKLKQEFEGSTSLAHYHPPKTWLLFEWQNQTREVT